MSVHDIYDLKQEFDAFIENEYRKAGVESTKQDILQGLFYNGERIHINATWEKVYLSKRYIVTFLNHLSDEEQIFEENKYIIRSFEDFKLVDETIYTEAGIFRGLEKDILVNASGVYCVREMAKKLLVSVKDIEMAYTRLNNRCLAYMSEF